VLYTALFFPALRTESVAIVLLVLEKEGGCVGRFPSLSFEELIENSMAEPLLGLTFTVDAYAVNCRKKVGTPLQNLLTPSFEEMLRVRSDA
jgi:hypothetical protein